MTLAQIGRLTGEHEATVSRQLARTRSALRVSIEQHLAREHSMGGEAVTECFRSLGDDAGPLDLAELLSESSGLPGAPGKKRTLDRSAKGGV